ncbi:MAG: YlmC/YmxH family sporulation protein [Lachnospiraceae bacterium]|nr:YlmC/YmxH family sporulation protein [Lachnospiraceae bacterium]
MLYSDFRKKEVINLRDCRIIGNVVDMEFDECSGCIKKIFVADRPCFCSFFSFFPGETGMEICFKDIRQIGPDIILVDVC